jgi:hypothetical protein
VHGLMSGSFELTRRLLRRAERRVSVFVPEGRSILPPFSRVSPFGRGGASLRTGVTRDFNVWCELKGQTALAWGGEGTVTQGKPRAKHTP